MGSSGPNPSGPYKPAIFRFAGVLKPRKLSPFCPPAKIHAVRANPKPLICRALGVDDRIRTGDRLDHNQELYQLSYVHRAAFNLACWLGRPVGA
jgi:hypothetical protein